MSVYDEVRHRALPTTGTRRHIDACEAVTNEILKIAYERISGIEEHFDPDSERQRLHEFINRDYALSIFGSSASHSHMPSTCHSRTSTVAAAKRAEAVADFAAKEAEYKMLLEEKRQKEIIQHLEEQQRAELEGQKCELEQIQAEKNLRAARARLQVYDQEAARESL